MTLRSRTFARACGILLLLLAVSPVTAPFSTCDLSILWGAPLAQGPALKVKASQDEPAATPGGSVDHRVVFGSEAHHAAARGSARSWRSLFDLQLRI
jgi:hypothetical protein